MKSQSSIEFMQAITLLLAVFVVLTPIVYMKYSDNLSAQLRADGQLTADTVAGEINIAAGVGPGYRRLFTLQPLLGDSSEYTVIIYPTEQRVFVNWTDSTGASAAIATSSVTQTSPLGPGDIIVFNNGGQIEIGG